MQSTYENAKVLKLLHETNIKEHDHRCVSRLF